MSKPIVLSYSRFAMDGPIEIPQRISTPRELAMALFAMSDHVDSLVVTYWGAAPMLISLGAGVAVPALVQDAIRSRLVFGVDLVFRAA